MEKESVVLPFQYGEMIIKNPEWWTRRIGEIDPDDPNRTFNGFIMYRAMCACTFVGARLIATLGGRSLSFVDVGNNNKESEEQQS